MSGDKYALSRNYIAASRLNLQHFIWKQALGYTLHPDILIKENMRIADVGTGTGVWLFDVAQDLAPSCHFKGFDVSAEQFTDKQWLPSNISFYVQDATREPPAYLHGQFDVVHLRLFLSIVDNNDPTSLLNHCLKLLKPGGYLQWDENDPHQTRVVSAQGPESAQAFQGFLNSIHSFKPMQWIGSLPEILRENGVHDVAVYKCREHPWQRRMLNEMQCVLAEEYTAALRARDGDVGEEIRMLAQKICAEVRQGSGWSSLFQVVVGRK